MFKSINGWKKVSFILFFLAGVGTVGMVYIPEAFGGRPSVTQNAANIAENLADIEKIQEAICDIFDQTAVTPRPDFCPEPPACPCWPGVAVNDIVAALNAANVAGEVGDPTYSVIGDPLGGAGSVTIGDNDDAIPIMSAVVFQDNGCKVFGLTPEIENIPGGSPSEFLVGISQEEAKQCAKDIVAAQVSLQWPVVVP